MSSFKPRRDTIFFFFRDCPFNSHDGLIVRQGKPKEKKKKEKHYYSSTTYATYLHQKRPKRASLKHHVLSIVPSQ